tara:strand:+ start:819 stop:1475 length:657 start_codon:yes stop_codon:yes gene_type:complete
MHKISELLKDCSSGHDDTQISSFMIIKNGGTIWGCYKQALKELAARISTLRASWINIQKLKRRLTIEEDDLENLSLELELGGVCAHAETVKREAAKIYSIASFFKDQIGDLTPEKTKKLDQELWLHRVKVHAVQDILDQARLSSSTRSMIQSLPKALKAKLHESLSDPEKLVEWFIAYDIEIPELESIASDTLKEINYVTDLDKSFKRLSSNVSTLSL